MDDWNNFVLSDREDPPVINFSKYHDSNCELCVHKKVYSLRVEYVDYVTNLRKYVDPKLDKFGIDITCNFFREEQPTPRAPIV